MSSASLSTKLVQLATLFLKLGTIGFGGPLAHMAMMNQEAVVRRSWLSEQQFSEALAMCEMLPGPASTQLGIYIGYVRAGQIGALVAGICFIAPAWLIVVALSWVYFRFQELPQVNNLFLGISPVIAAIIFGFCWKLGKKTLKDWWSWATAVAVLLISLNVSVNILLLFLIAGLAGLVYYGRRRTLSVILPLPLHLASTVTETLTVASVWGTERISQYAWPLFRFFVGVGSFIFGGGLVIIPLIEFEVVQQLNWLTANEFLNGVAIGQLSPGPVVLTAAFVGYKVAGILGALVASVGIFLPSFAFICLAAPLLLRIRDNVWVKSFLRGVTPAVLGAIAAATIPLTAAAILQTKVSHSIGAGVILILSLVGLIRFRLPPWQLILFGAVAGLLLGLL